MAGQTTEKIIKKELQISKALNSKLLYFAKFAIFCITEDNKIGGCDFTILAARCILGPGRPVNKSAKNHHTRAAKKIIKLPSKGPQKAASSWLVPPPPHLRQKPSENWKPPSHLLR